MNREIFPNAAYPLTGDVTSTAGDPKVKVTGLQGIPIATTTPTDGQVLEYIDATGLYTPVTIAAGTVTSVFGRIGVVVAVAGDYGPTLGGTGVTAWLKGDLLVGSGTNTTSTLAVGTDGYVLVADSTQTVGIKWAASSTIAPVTSVFGRVGAVVAVAGDYGPTLGGTGQTAWVKGDTLVGSGVNTTDRLAVGSDGQYVKADSTATDGLRWVDHYNIIGIDIDGGVTTPTTGTKGRIQVPFDCVIQSWTILTDVSGSCQFDVQKGTYSAFPTVSSIVASAPPVLSSAQKATSSTLTGWTTTITAGDVIVFFLSSVSTVTNITLELKVKRS